MNDEAVMSELVRSYQGSTDALAVWRRANYKCEYCHTRVRDSADAYLYGAHLDHIVPGAGQHLDNLALGCKHYGCGHSDEGPYKRRRFDAANSEDRDGHPVAAAPDRNKGSSGY